MPDDKLRVPDSAALYDFIALIGACFTVHRRSSSLLFPVHILLQFILAGDIQPAVLPRSGKYRISYPWMHKNHHKNMEVSGFPAVIVSGKKPKFPSVFPKPAGNLEKIIFPLCEPPLWDKNDASAIQKTLSSGPRN